MSIGGQSVGNVHLNSWVWRGREEGGGGRGEESEAGESTACNFAKNFIHTHTSMLTVHLLSHSPVNCVVLLRWFTKYLRPWAV